MKAIRIFALVLVFVFILAPVTAFAAGLDITSIFGETNDGKGWNIAQPTAVAGQDLPNIIALTVPYNVTEVDTDDIVGGTSVALYGDPPQWMLGGSGPVRGPRAFTVGENKVNIIVKSGNIDYKLRLDITRLSETKEPAVELAGAIPANVVASGISTAITNGTNATFKGYDGISAATLAQAKSVVGNRFILLNFDTMNGKAVEGRLTINPSNITNDISNISLGVYTNAEQTSKVQSISANFSATLSLL